MTTQTWVGGTERSDEPAEFFFKAFLQLEGVELCLFCPQTSFAFWADWGTGQEAGGLLPCGWSAVIGTQWRIRRFSSHRRKLLKGCVSLCHTHQVA
jgi:hypothetical protein